MFAFYDWPFSHVYFAKNVAYPFQFLVQFSATVSYFMGIIIKVRRGRALRGRRRYQQQTPLHLCRPNVVITEQKSLCRSSRLGNLHIGPYPANEQIGRRVVAQRRQKRTVSTGTSDVDGHLYLIDQSSASLAIQLCR